MAVTTPDPHAAGSTRHSSWWVIQQISPGKGQGVPIYSVIMATSKPANAVSGPYSSQNAANQAANQMNGGGINIPNPLNIVSGWFGSLGSMIGSGIESGLVTFFTDLWKVIVGPLEILLGVLIGMWVLVIYFKDDIRSLIGAVGGISMAMA